MSERTTKPTIFGEFREFIARGNVIDLAVGVIIGAAFNDIVKSLVDNVVMPPIGLLLSGLGFNHLDWVLKPDNPLTKADELVAIKYGAFINTSIKFLIVAWVVFWLVKGVNAPRRSAAAGNGRLLTRGPRRCPRRPPPRWAAADGDPRSPEVSPLAARRSPCGRAPVPHSSIRAAMGVQRRSVRSARIDPTFFPWTPRVARWLHLGLMFLAGRGDPVRRANDLFRRRARAAPAGMPVRHGHGQGRVDLAVIGHARSGTSATCVRCDRMPFRSPAPAT